LTANKVSTAVVYSPGRPALDVDDIWQYSVDGDIATYKHVNSKV